MYTGELIFKGVMVISIIELSDTHGFGGFYGD